MRAFAGLRARPSIAPFALANPIERAADRSIDPDQAC
jgi:hypothetical protein